jgi:hypothetical protein
VWIVGQWLMVYRWIVGQWLMVYRWIVGQWLMVYRRLLRPHLSQKRHMSKSSSNVSKIKIKRDKCLKRPHLS